MLDKNGKRINEANTSEEGIIVETIQNESRSARRCLIGKYSFVSVSGLVKSTSSKNDKT